MSQVGVIIPTFNRAHVLERALDSVAAQTFRDWELVIVDDGSTDGTRELVENWIARQPTGATIRYFSQGHRGVSAARNFGVAQTHAPWIAFLDSDDEWLPGKLEKQFALTPHFSIVHGEEIWIRRGVRVNPMKKHAKSGGRIFKRCVDLCCVSPSTVMLERETFLQLGGFRDDFPVCEDYELWLRWCSEREVGFIETSLIKKYGGHEDQLSLTHRAMDYYRVKALLPFLESACLSEDERAHVAATLQTKCEILIHGYRKHDNLAHLEEVENYLRKVLTESQIAHSAAERRPRSVNKLSL